MYFILTRYKMYRKMRNTNGYELYRYETFSIILSVKGMSHTRNSQKRRS